MMQKEKKPIAFLFIGRSGCGKGTQADIFIKKFKETHPHEPLYYLESGKNFREFISKENFSSVLSKKIMETGKLQPEFLAVWVWSHLMIRNMKEGEHLVLDGVPRKLREAHVLETAFDFYGFKEVYVIHIDITREETKRRLAIRGRMDDKDPKEVDERLDWFDNDVTPAIEFYSNNPRYKYIHVNGEREIEVVHDEIIEKVGL
ncbi:MAG: nucleoside monophosphate kinase [bacterium]